MLRRVVQIISALAANPYFPSLFRRQFYQGQIKGICVPILNCYSCPLAVGACPIGSLQNSLASLRSSIAAAQYQLGLYIIGTLGFVGSLIGRMPCGWLCPFGLMQELLYKISTPKFSIPRFVSYLKYAFLVIMVVALPVLIIDEFGYGQTWFCKLICPAGTLEAGLPMVGLSENIRSQIGSLFSWKVGLLVIFLGWMVVSKRPFCRVICPLGAYFSLFNKVSFFRMTVDHGKCVKCDACYRNCPTELRIYETPNSPDCIRCLECVKACEFGAVNSEFVYNSELFSSISQTLSLRSLHRRLTRSGRRNL
jgi:polyferredoxin